MAESLRLGDAREGPLSALLLINGEAGEPDLGFARGRPRFELHISVQCDLPAPAGTPAGGIADSWAGARRILGRRAAGLAAGNGQDLGAAVGEAPGRRLRYLPHQHAGPDPY